MIDKVTLLEFPTWTQTQMSVENNRKQNEKKNISLPATTDSV